MGSSVLDLSTPMPTAAEAEASSGPEEPKLSRTAVAMGVGCVAAFVGYTLYRSYLPTPPQALLGGVFGTSEEATPTRSVRLACVNFTDDEKRALQLSMPVLRSSDGVDVAVDFPTVTFYDDAPHTTIDSLRESTRQATMFAFRELNRRSHQFATACAILQSAVEVNGNPLELGDSNARLLHYANGRCARYRRCLGFSANGEGVEVVEWELCGVVDSSRARSRWASAEALERQNAHIVLQYCCVPSETSFTPSLRHRPGTTHEAQRVCEGDKSLLKVPATVGASRTAFDDEAFSLWWQSALPISLVFTTAMRYAREADGGLAALLVSSQQAASPWTRLRALTQKVLAWCGVTSSTTHEATLADPIQPPVDRQVDALKWRSSSRHDDANAHETRRRCYGPSSFAVSVETETGIDLGGHERVSWWEARVSAIVARGTQRRAADTATRVHCVNCNAAGVAFELPVQATLVEALKVALDTASLVSWSGVRPRRIRVATLDDVPDRNVAGSEASTPTALGSVPFRSGCSDLVGTKMERELCAATPTRSWHILAQFP